MQFFSVFAVAAAGAVVADDNHNDAVAIHRVSTFVKIANLCSFKDIIPILTSYLLWGKNCLFGINITIHSKIICEDFVMVLSY